MAFSDQLEATRRARGLSQAQLATKASVHSVQLSRYEVGSAMPSLQTVKRLAVALNVSTDELLFDPGERKVTRDFALLVESVESLPKKERDALRVVIEAVVADHDRSRVKPVGMPPLGRPRTKKHPSSK